MLCFIVLLLLHTAFYYWFADFPGHWAHSGSPLIKLNSSHWFMIHHKYQAIHQSLMWLAVSTVAGAIAFALLKQHHRLCIYLTVLGLLSVGSVGAPFSLMTTSPELTPWLWGITAVLLRLKSQIMATILVSDHAEKQTLLVYASQTGSAKRLATQIWQTASGQLELRDIADLTPESLMPYSRVLFVVSTYGTGQPPDSARRFASQLSAHQCDANTTAFSVLALGDSHYADFCGFGYWLKQRLLDSGYHCCTPLVTVDKLSKASIEKWLGDVNLGESTELAQTGASSSLISVQVESNRCCNPLQPARFAHRIVFRTKNPLTYQAGDLLKVFPDEGEQSHLPRYYSIASAGQDKVEILVRKQYRADGSPGLCSGMLCGLTPGQSLNVGIEEHSRFRLQGDRPLILIGAGTGIAPLIGLLEQKHLWQSQQPHWLIFGERSPFDDHYFAPEIETYQQQGVLSRVNCAWSSTGNHYVQDILAEHIGELSHWIKSLGAHLYLCGKHNGFGQEVSHFLEQHFTDEQLQHLHRDLY